MPSLSARDTPTELPEPLRSMNNAEIRDAIHDAFYGPAQPKNGEPRLYYCVVEDCNRHTDPFMVADNDHRISVRISHAKNNHNWVAVVVEYLASEALRLTGTDYAAQVAADYGLAMSPPSSPSRHLDEAKLLFVHCSRVGWAFKSMENPQTRKLLNLKTVVSAKAISKAGEILAKEYRQKIQTMLPTRFAIALDGWKGLDEHFLGVFAVFPKDEKTQFLLLGMRPISPRMADAPGPQPQQPGPELDAEIDQLVVVDPGEIDEEDHPSEFEPMGEDLSPLESDDGDAANIDDYLILDYRLDADAHVAAIESLLAEYDRSVEHSVLFFVGDNAPVNQAMARRVAKPMIGCHAHLLNLALKRFLHPHRVAIAKVDWLMRHVANNHALCNFMKKAAGCKPQASVATRWRSVFEMLCQFYERIHAHIPYTRIPNAQSRVLEQDELTAIRDIVMAYRGDLEALIDALDADNVSLIDARQWFRDLLNDSTGRYSATMEAYLGPNPVPVTGIPLEFIKAVCKFAAGESLSPVEQRVLAPVLGNDAAPTRQRFARSSPEVRPSERLLWIPATTTVVERFFSVARRLTPYLRQSLSPETLENQLLANWFANQHVTARQEARSFGAADDLAEALRSIQLQ